jgi:uncharacterized protein (TIGR00255 family)
MTGFGAGRSVVGSEELSVEIKSLNHKFCEVKARLPRELSALEALVARKVKERLARGAIEVFVKRASSLGAASVPTVDVALAREYHRALKEVANATGIPGELRIIDIASQPGVIRIEERGVDVEAATRALEAALDQALEALGTMRKLEGDALRADLSSRLSLVEAASREVAALAPRAVTEHQARLSERIAELARGVPLDPQRLSQEVAFFAERTDVAEELSRLSSHLVQFRALIDSPEPAGRKMDFLVQEMHREVNTTGSKSQHPEISSRVVSLKAELERIREQVQNVE